MVGPARTALTKRELAVNKEQRDLVKGKRPDDGQAVAQRKQRKEKEKEPPKHLSGFVINPLALFLCARSQSHHAAVSPRCAHKSQHLWLSFHRVCRWSLSSFLPLRYLSPPGPLLKVRLPFPGFLFLGAHLKVLKAAL